ncbi:MAG TPA: hypothetical protein VEW42_03400 [Candidatus Eisenbacteria bacterium]|nr:hypothetical protein [Candidatus Eisenbacteria bacterium]
MSAGIGSGEMSSIAREAVSKQAAPIKQPVQKGLAQEAFGRISSAITAAKEAGPGGRMKALVGVLRGDEPASNPVSVTANTHTESFTASAQEKPQQDAVVEGQRLSPSSQQFLKRMDRPSLVTKVLATRDPEGLARAQVVVQSENVAVITKLLGPDMLQAVENGSANADALVAQRVRDLANSQNPRALEELFGKASDETVFAIRRMEEALWANRATRQEAKMLHTLRKRSDYTVPKYIRDSSREIFQSLGSGAGKQMVDAIQAALSRG